MSDEPTTTPDSSADEAPTKAAPKAATTAAPAAATAGRGRRIAYWVVLVLTTLLATVAIFAVWANRQLLNTDNWTKTSTQLLENQAIRDQTATFITDQLYANVDVQGEIQGFLPPILQPLAAPAAGAARNLVDEIAGKALQNPAVQNVWSDANRTAHERLVNVVEDKGQFTTTTGNTVSLDLTPIITAVAVRAGLPSSVTSKIPADAGQVEILKADELSTAQTAVKTLKTLDWFLRILCVLGFGFAIWLAKGRRAQALVASGVGLIIAGLAALIIRSIAGGTVVTDLAATEAVRPAATAAWNIGTELLKTIAWSAIFVGIPAIVVGLILGGSGWAKALRTKLAPIAHDRPEFLYGGAALIVLLLVVWEPVPATRRILTIVVFLAVIVGGAYALRKLTLEEHPDLEALPAGGPGLRERASSATAAVRRPATPAEATAPADHVARLERLVALRDGGALSDTEFEAEKAKLLADEEGGA